jgi:uncharacterized protein with HEPN domain
MSERTDDVYLQDIIVSIDAIEKYLSDISEDEFAANQMLQDAVIRRFEIIGEAANHISQKFKDDHPAIEWRLMSDMRNKLIHEYFGVNTSTVYETVKVSLPELKEKIQSIRPL